MGEEMGLKDMCKDIGDSFDKWWKVAGHGERGIKDDSSLLSLDKCKDSAFIN